MTPNRKPRISASSESPQRYWRRRANRRVRKARLTRAMREWGPVLTIHVFLLVALAFGGMRLYNGVLASDALSLGHVAIVGTDRSSESEIQERLASFKGENLLDLDLKEIARAVQLDPWVARVSAKRMLPDTLRITVHEREASAIAMIGGLAHVVDTAGFVIGPLQAGQHLDVPILTGLEDFREDEALIRALRRGARALGRLREETGPWVEELSEMDLSRDDRLTVWLMDGGPPLRLHPNRVALNVPEWIALRDDIADRISDAEWIDLRWRDRISVMPRTAAGTSKGEG